MRQWKPQPSNAASVSWFPSADGVIGDGPPAPGSAGGNVRSIPTSAHNHRRFPRAILPVFCDPL